LPDTHGAIMPHAHGHPALAHQFEDLGQQS